MNRILERYQNEIVINKSRFISLMMPISTDSEVKEILKELNKEFPKATHYCYAYRVNGKEKSSDDGEPSGTAGRPMLEFLINNQLENILVVVIRYFGGIKLGAGGLLRAYVDGCRSVYSVSRVFRVEKHTLFNLVVDYKYYDALRNYLIHQEGTIKDTDYQEEITISYLSSSINNDDLLEITNGNIKIINQGEQEVFIERN
jgi:uncharacterized YigZ family protein